MKLSRRRFAGGMAMGSAGLIAQTSFAAIRTGERPELLDRAMAALDTHDRRLAHRDVMGLVDFSKSSGTPRFQIVDIGNGRVLGNYLVSHGRGSDPANTGMLQRFSNRPGSNASSRGSYAIGATYYGKHGRSRRLLGLDPDNNLAHERAIVIHGANYVSAGMARSQGRVGRSLGCFSVAKPDIDEVLQRLGPGRLLYAAR